MPPAFAVLPIGSCEQHGGHLPLLTDALTVDWVANEVGRRLGGWILATLPYGTSYEHVGFPGTVTLRWATLAAIVRDVVDSLAEQGVMTVFVLSGHGGNFVLNPCVRDLNRDAPSGRRVVLVPDDVFFGPALSADGHADLHAGWWETSLLLALDPAAVQLEHAVDHVPDAGRAALTNKPMRALSPSGVWGRPRAATVERGTLEAEATVDRVASFVSGWLRELEG